MESTLSPDSCCLSPQPPDTRTEVKHDPYHPIHWVINTENAIVLVLLTCWLWNLFVQIVSILLIQGYPQLFFMMCRIVDIFHSRFKKNNRGGRGGSKKSLTQVVFKLNDKWGIIAKRWTMLTAACKWNA